MRSIAILNQKGGVGKTTTSVNIAAALSRMRKRVLLIDLDPQSHASIHLGVDAADGAPTIYDVLVQNAALADAAREVDRGLVLIPAHLDLVGAELELADRPDRESILADVLHTYQDAFDYCVLDCAPSLGLLTINALVAVREVIIPLQPHFLALQGLGRLLQTVSLVRESLNPELRVTGVVLCMFERGTRLTQEVSDDVRRFIASATERDPWFGARLFDTPIRRNIKLAESPSFGRTIFAYAPSSHGAEDYAALAREIHAGGKDAAGSAGHRRPARHATEPPQAVDEICGAGEAPAPAAASVSVNG